MDYLLLDDRATTSGVSFFFDPQDKVGFAIFNFFNLLTLRNRGFLLTRPEINFISAPWLKK